MREFRILFWDFDGVIKDSVTVKSLAFEQLFLPYGNEVARRVRAHHEANGGVSRYQKMPVYLSWAGEAATESRVEEFCQRFSGLVRQAVIDSAWVPGVREYLESNRTQQYFVLLSATPQDEMEQILDALGLLPCFREVHGAPTPKAKAIRDVLERLRCLPEHALVLGDSETDLDAAEANHVTFCLRRTPLNQTLQQRYSGLAFDDLNHE